MRINYFLFFNYTTKSVGHAKTSVDFRVKLEIYVPLH